MASIYSHSTGSSLVIVLPLILLFSTLTFLFLLFSLALLVLRLKKRSISLSNGGRYRRLTRLTSSNNQLFLPFNDDHLNLAPIDLTDMDFDNGLAGWATEESGGQQAAIERYYNSLQQPEMMGIQRARDYQEAHPPASLATAITLSQYLTIQEKGVSAWSFEPDYESLPPILVQARTELTFLADGEGLSPSEGGACSVQTNLPIPRSNDTYYFEAKLFEITPSTKVSFGLATKPYPSFRLPGDCKYSVSYDTEGQAAYNYPFTSHTIGSPLLEGDVLGIGYKPRTGTVFFTRNGKRLDPAPYDGAFHAFGNSNAEGVNPLDLFPTIGSTGAAVVHVNFGQAGFVFIEANVKKWGLAPMSGTLAPPPAYGHNSGSLLLESAANKDTEDSENDERRPLTFDERRRLERRLNERLKAESEGKDDIDPGVGTSTTNRISTRPEDDGIINNPPTPNQLDISLTELERRRSTQALNEQDNSQDEAVEEEVPSEIPETAESNGDAPPPHYAPIDPQRYPDGVSLTDIPSDELVRMIGDT
ncbi:SPRY-domain-containing protein [Wallemia mellicola]|uniref:SPRY-domain-containing protein n=1 Tax=Wallemia mellicola TaxID=1708541 RepID=A0A4V4N2T5_9BASI|nr:hypothetical protein E3Q24_03953 [Wallemia mellicola]TIB72456.1 hypothetical protein E3Q23_03377 [Wallemia mellicola]TIB76981.1 SPRY-domain-containing protein [Wallemia mellicola]TIB82219.1 SPRY-domain-containing protein [Wallemia mellicola]TIB84946.1 SPRY-domain-containing protein [Wallemia mellicola]